MKMAELVRDYNRLTGKAVRRFSSLAVGMERVAQAQQLDTLATFCEQEHPKKSRSDATKAQWTNTRTAKARSARDHVRVEDHGEFKSTMQAFLTLQLPMTGHIRFRIALKRDGIRSLTHNGIVYRFSLAKPAQEAAA